MAAILGKIEEFDRSKEEWPQYVERLGHFFAANDIVSREETVSVSCHGRTYHVQAIAQPARPRQAGR